PVGVDIVVDPADGPEIRHVVTLETAKDRRMAGFEGLERTCEADEDEALPERRADGVQWIGGGIESGSAFHVWRASKTAIEAISPRVVRASNRVGKLPGRLFTESAASVAADVVECA